MIRLPVPASLVGPTGKLVQMWPEILKALEPLIAASRRHVYRGEYEQDAHNQTDQGPCDVRSPWPGMGAEFFASRLHVTPYRLSQVHRRKPIRQPLQVDVRRTFLRECDAVHTRPNSSGHFGTIQTGPPGAGNDRSRHQAEPLPGANGLDLLDHEAKPASLAAASREQEKP